MHDTLFPMVNADLPIYVVGLGLEFIQKGTNRAEGYEHYQWLQTMKGSGFLETEEWKVHIHEGESVLIPPGIPHAYYPSEEEWIQNWVIFDGTGVVQYLTALRLEPFILLKTGNTAMTVQLLKNVMIENDTVNSAVRRSAWMIEFLRMLREEDTASGAGQSKKICRALAYIHDHYSKFITMEDIAQTCGFSAQHFCKIFYKEMKMRPFEYINRIRITKAKELLIEYTNMPLGQIACAVGFSSDSYFCRVFKKYEGISPAKFRNVL